MIAYYPDMDIPKADLVDYTDVAEVCGYQMLLCKIYEREGGGAYPVACGPAVSEVQFQGRVLLREVKALLDGDKVTPGAVPELLKGYDLMHRICYGSSCNDYLREVKLRTVDCWLKGDRSISNTDVTLLLLSETDSNINALDDRYTKYAISVVASWIDELIKQGNFTDIPLAEAYRRLTYLLKTDLFAFMTRNEERQVKAYWVSSHILTVEQIDALDTDTLWAYARFIDSIPFGSGQEHERIDAMYMQALSKIASHPDTHPYTRRAIGIELSRPSSPPSPNHKTNPIMLADKAMHCLNLI